MTSLIQNGKIQAFPPINLPWGDPAIQYGWAGFFESMRCGQGRVRRLGAHLERLHTALKHWKMAPPCALELLEEAIGSESRTYPLNAPLRIKIIVGEDPSAEIREKGILPTRAWINACALDDEYCPSFRDRKLFRLGFFRDYPISSTHPLSGFKSTQYGLFREARRRVRLQGWDEAIMLNEMGQVTEASAFNIFWFKNDRLITPALSSGCLPGIMAAEIEKVAAKVGIQVERQLAMPQDMGEAETILLTNSVAEIIGAESLNERTLVPPLEHPLARRLIEAVESEAHTSTEPE